MKKIKLGTLLELYTEDKISDFAMLRIFDVTFRDLGYYDGEYVHKAEFIAKLISTISTVDLEIV